MDMKNAATEALPGFLKPCFWDIKFEDLHYKEHPRFVIERILEYGGREAIKWMMTAYPRSQIIDTLSWSRNLSPKSADFWALFYRVDRERIRCLKKSFRETRKIFWPY